MDSIIKLDPDFSMALALNNFGNRDSRRANIIKAYSLKDDLSYIESKLIEGIYEQTINGDLKKAEDIVSLLLDEYPDYYQLYIISGNLKNNLEDPNGSQVMWEKALEIYPECFEALENLAFLGGSILIEGNGNKLFGKTKNNIFTLYDIGMLGIVKHSRAPLRFVTFLGFVLSFFSLLIAASYFIYKLIFWNSFDVGIAPLVIGIFGFASIQILLLGIIGEYVGVLLIHQRNLPLVIEKERINF